MDALTALAWSLPPSFAFVIGAAAWLQRERDRRVNSNTQARVEAQGLAVEEHEFKLRSLSDRMTEVERNIGMLTDRAMR